MLEQLKLDRQLEPQLERKSEQQRELWTGWRKEQRKE